MEMHTRKLAGRGHVALSAFRLQLKKLIVLLAIGPAFTVGNVGLSAQQPSDDNRKADVKSMADAPLPTDASDFPPVAGKSDPYISTVGLNARISQIVIAGSEIEARPIVNRDQPVVVRIVETFPHGTDFRYDLEFYGLEPGEFNLSDYLRRKDQSDTKEIEPIYIQIDSLLGPGQVEPTELEVKPSRFSSFYLPVLLVGAGFWLLGLLMILFYGRGKTKRPVEEAKNITVADRLKPLVEAAMAGNIESEQQAELERVLSSFWGKKLRLNHLPATELRTKLRQHPEAGKLLEQIDDWLHKPNSNESNSNGTVTVDVANLLKPYQSTDMEDV